MAKEKMRFYSLDRILKEDAEYYMIFGERSNGKTFQVLLYALEKYFRGEGQLGIIRRWEEDFVGSQSMRTCYKSLECDANGVNHIARLSHNLYNGVEYYGGVYYLTQYDKEKDITRKTDKIIARAFAITSAEHYKGSSYPDITTILFDEFMTRKLYLPNEWVDLCSIFSTIIRSRDGVKIFMCANTVNKYGCIYFEEMGLYRIKDMEQGTIDVYDYNTEDGHTMKVAVEWTDSVAKNKPSNKYFAFKSERLKMVTQGAWEMDFYPHCPEKYVPKDIAFIYFVQFEGKTLQCEIIVKPNKTFTFIHRKTTPLKDADRDMIFTTEYDTRYNYFRKLTKPRNDAQRKLLWYYANDKVYYQDNDVGEIMRNYLQWCNQ